MHGKTDQIHHDNRGLFEGLENPFIATRYHSLVIQPDTLPDEFEVSAWSDAPDGSREIMGIRHKQFPAVRRPVPSRELLDRLRDNDPRTIPSNEEAIVGQSEATTPRVSADEPHAKAQRRKGTADRVSSSDSLPASFAVATDLPSLRFAPLREIPFCSCRCESVETGLLWGSSCSGRRCRRWIGGRWLGSRRFPGCC